MDGEYRICYNVENMKQGLLFSNCQGPSDPGIKVLEIIILHMMEVTGRHGSGLV